MYHIIINPASRSGKGIRLWQQEVVPYLEKNKIPYAAHFSNKQGDIAKIATPLAKAASKENHITMILFGGDGTFNEAIQHIDDFSNITIGYVPTGSSNDLARDLGVTKGPVEALDNIFKDGHIHPMDIGEVVLGDGTKRRFAVSCGIGFDAAVCADVNQSTAKYVLNKLGLGKLAYVGIALTQLCSAAYPDVTIELDNGKTISLHRYLFIVAMNHRYEGGGFKFCPMANSADGILDMCTVIKRPLPVLLCALVKAYSGKHFSFRGIKPYASSRFVITSSEPQWVHTDGEVVGKTDKLTITCKKQVINMMY